MNPAIFIDDFERTENTDELHAILGRALIVATRFDSMCKAAALYMALPKASLFLASDEARSLLLKKVAEKHRTLSSSIGSLKLPKDVALLLEDANAARNVVVHELAQGLTGCLDTKTNDEVLVRQVYDVVFALAYGDVVISHVISELNNDPLPNADFLSTYVERVAEWVVER